MENGKQKMENSFFTRQLRISVFSIFRFPLIYFFFSAAALRFKPCIFARFMALRRNLSA